MAPLWSQRLVCPFWATVENMVDSVWKRTLQAPSVDIKGSLSGNKNTRILGPLYMYFPQKT